MTTAYLLGDDLTQGILFMEAVEQWKKSGIFIQIEKADKSSCDLTKYDFSVEDPIAHLALNDPKGIFIHLSVGWGTVSLYNFITSRERYKDL